jgi:hypothetical protein
MGFLFLSTCPNCPAYEFVRRADCRRYLYHSMNTPGQLFIVVTMTRFFLLKVVEQAEYIAAVHGPGCRSAHRQRSAQIVCQHALAAHTTAGDRTAVCEPVCR